MQENKTQDKDIAQKYFECSYFMYKNAGDKETQDYLIKNLGEKFYWDCCTLGKIVNSTLKTFEI